MHIAYDKGDHNNINDKHYDDAVWRVNNNIYSINRIFRDTMCV